MLASTNPRPWTWPKMPNPVPPGNPWANLPPEAVLCAISGSFVCGFLFLGHRIGGLSSDMLSSSLSVVLSSLPESSSSELVTCVVLSPSPESRCAQGLFGVFVIPLFVHLLADAWPAVLICDVAASGSRRNGLPSGDLLISNGFVNGVTGYEISKSGQGIMCACPWPTMMLLSDGSDLTCIVLPRSKRNSTMDRDSLCTRRTAEAVWMRSSGLLLIRSICTDAYSRGVITDRSTLEAGRTKLNNSGNE
ncbi:hypothetical protein BKA67DRAFT_642154 [Truncatella angustata]|uniref:Uncharacterized protein n=1 Tax=Truncatella angustata TaxID=152316 RepID=A0A9P8UZV2_9PEZI|nr:uncharacterized protein BKA67DRAFT_642154 [Truncatella angustata]KAH6661155.1 hypothetical protein BKA67DRAFT_642154 [Truncatella angustata]